MMHRYVFNGSNTSKSKATGQNTSQAPGRPSLETSRGFSGGKQSWKKEQVTKVACTQKKEHFSTNLKNTSRKYELQWL